MEKEITKQMFDKMPYIMKDGRLTKFYRRGKIWVTTIIESEGKYLKVRHKYSHFIFEGTPLQYKTYLTNPFKP